MPSMAVRLMEGSYYILLSHSCWYISLRRPLTESRIQTNFRKHTKFRESMAYPPSNRSRAPLPCFMYSAIRTGAPGLMPFPTANGYELKNFNAPYTVDSCEPTDYDSCIENLSGPLFSNPCASYGQDTTNTLIPNQPAPDPMLLNGMLPCLFSHGHEPSAAATPSNNINIHALPFNATPSDENSVHASLFNAIPSSNNNVHAPLLNAAPSDLVNFPEDDDWMKQIEAYAYTDVPHSQGTANCSQFPTNAIPLSDPIPPVLGNLQDVAPGTATFNSRRVHYLAHTNNTIYCNKYNVNNSLVPPTISTPHDVSSVINPNDLGSSGTPAASCTSTLQCTAPETTDSQGFVSAPPSISTTCCPPLNFSFSNLEPEGTSAPPNCSTERRLAPKQTTSSGLESLGDSTSMSVAPRTKKRNRRKLSQDSAPDDVDPTVSRRTKCPRSNAPSQSKRARKSTNLKSHEPSDIPVPDPLIPDRTNFNCSEHSHPSTNSEDDEEAMFIQYTTLCDEHEPEQSAEQPETGSFNAPDASKTNHKHIHDASETCTGEHCTKGHCKSHQTTDAGSAEVLRSPEKRRRRKQAKAERKRYSTRPSRINPKQLFFCIDPTCRCSQEQGFRGFAKKDDFERHLATHGVKLYICTLPHAKGRRFRCYRADNMNNHLIAIHSDRKADEEEVEAVRSQRHPVPKAIPGVNCIIVKRRG